MRVLQIIDFLPETSGGARFVVNLAKKLKLKGLEVDVLLIDGRDSHFLEELKNSNINIITISKNINRFNILYALKISKYLDKYDVIHTHIFPTSYQVSIARMLNKKSAPIIFTEHSSFNRRASNFLFKYIEIFIYSKFDKIICLSEQVKFFLQKNLSFKDSKYEIIQNAVDTNNISISKSAIREEIGLKKNDFIILMSARFDQPKRQDLLIEVVKLLPENIKILFAGSGYTLDFFKNKVLEELLSHKVIFLGARTDIYELMKMADVNILASDYEGLSLAALEAMSIGRPFIASDVEGLDFVVNNKEYLFNNEIDSLKKLILKLYNESSFYEKCASYSLKRSKDFDIEIMVDKYLKVYNNQIENKGEL
ncbi:glycosyltransferase family 4 protein [Acinetobacter sp. YH12233]|uniref:glycosyltransferase family 4 protein n=1 Tax=Acinetobacter sp. YH12233 TaxID=2601161 RepID=UPI0015D34E85|nr:glycosyltransferase family 4 protein [Acinetobacter sp. YH12233]